MSERGYLFSPAQCLRWSLCLAALPLLVSMIMSATDSAAFRDSQYRVSLIQLIANPADYESKKVSVFGYLSDDGFLYLTKDHAAAGDQGSSIIVEAPRLSIDDGCSDNYVFVSGRFDVPKGSWTGRLFESTRIVTAGGKNVCDGY